MSIRIHQTRISQRLLSALLALLLTVACLPLAVIGASAATTLTADTSWETDADGAYKLTTREEVYGFFSQLHGGKLTVAKTYRLYCDADFTGVDFPVAAKKGFLGVFDGNGHTLSGIHVTATADGYGIFGGQIVGAATVKDLAVVDSSITASCVYVGAIFGLKTTGNATSPNVNPIVLENLYVDVDITNSYQYSSTATTDGDKRCQTGGLIGRVGHSTTLTNCVYAGNIEITSDAQAAGGLIGAVEGTGTYLASGLNLTASNCAFYGSLKAGGQTSSPLFGFLNNATTASISNCIAAGHWGYSTTSQNGVVWGYTAGLTGNKTVTNLYYTHDANVFVTTSPTEPTVYRTTEHALKSVTSLQLIEEWGLTAWSRIDAYSYPLPKTVALLLPEGARPVSESTRLIGYQRRDPDAADGRFDLRLVAVVDGLAYQNIGFDVEIRFDINGKAVQSVTNAGEAPITEVYGMLTGSDENDTRKTYTAAELGGAYIFALNITGIPDVNGLYFTVTTYHTDPDGQKTADHTESFVLSKLGVPVLPDATDAAPLNFKLSESDRELRYSSVTKEDYLAYCARLEALGYTKYTAHTLANNAFATYTGYGKSIYVSYFDATDRLQIVHGDKGYLPAISAPAYEAVVTPTVTQLADSVGMSYLIQLADGSFVMVDGGTYGTVSSDGDNAGNETTETRYNDADIENLYNVIKEKYDAIPTASKPESGKPEITWLISHAHTDHITLATQFLRVYHDKINLKTVGYNLPDCTNKSLKTIVKENTDEYKNEFEGALSLVQGFCNVVERYFPNADTFVMHTGQRLLLAGCEIDVLYTYEDYLHNDTDENGDPYRFRWLNYTSTVWKMTFADPTDSYETDLLLTADIEYAVVDQLINTYGASVLKTDILQIIHHGYSGGRDEFSNLFANSTERTVCLWPASAAKFNDDRRTGKNAATGFNKILRDAENCFHFHAEQNLTVDLIDLTVTSEGVVLTADHDGKSYSADAE